METQAGEAGGGDTSTLHSGKEEEWVWWGQYVPPKQHQVSQFRAGFADCLRNGCFTTWERLAGEHAVTLELSAEYVGAAGTQQGGLGIHRCLVQEVWFKEVSDTYKQTRAQVDGDYSVSSRIT